MQHYSPSNWLHGLLKKFHSYLYPKKEKMRLYFFRTQPFLLLPILFFIGLNWQRKDRKKNPQFYRPHGIYVFSGLYGSGKTISMVRYLDELVGANPKIIVCSNFDIPHHKSIPLTSIKQINEMSDPNGIVFVIDEAQLTFNSHDKGKDAFPLDIVSAITQNRKEGKVLLFSAQHFYHVNKQIRDLCFRIVHCNSFMGLYFRNKWYDADSYDRAFAPDIEKRPWSLRTDRFIGYPELYDSFSTYKKLGRLSLEDPESKPLRADASTT